MVIRRSNNSLFAPISYAFSFSTPNGVACAALIGFGFVPPPLKPVEYWAYVMKCSVHWYCRATLGSTREVLDSTGMAGTPNTGLPGTLIGSAGTFARLVPSYV